MHEVAKGYLGPALISYDMEDMFMSKRDFDQLPPDLQEIMHLATRIYAVEFASLSTYASAECVKLMKDAGVKFSALPTEDLAAARKISDEALQRMAGDDEDTKRRSEEHTSELQSL